ncbi:MAG: hypothetical protein AAFV88_17710 [Planctomycetota bacterium]
MATEAILPRPTTGRLRTDSAADTPRLGWFAWKEFRQVVPLLGLLLLIALLVVGILVLQSTVAGASARNSIPVALLLFPALFATGSGPLLVGQERSTKTLDWLVLLPISIRQLFTVKVVVSIVCLIAMWLFQFLILIVLGQTDFILRAWWSAGVNESISMGYVTLMTHSLFLLFVGFYAAWRIENQFHSIVVLVPLAATPIVAANICDAYQWMPFTTELVALMFTVLGLFIAIPASYLAARRTLGIQAAPTFSPGTSIPKRGVAVSPAFEVPQFGTSTGAMIWQSIVSTPIMWSVLIAMCLVSFGALAAMDFWLSAEQGRRTAGSLPLLFVLAPVAVTWLGVMVFKYDGSAQQVRFLSQRGVSPAKILLSRHAVPLAILCGCGCVYGIWQLLGGSAASADIDYEDVIPLPSLTLILLVGLTLYSVGQWMSQLLRTLILAVVLAPLVAGMVVGWLFYAGAMFGTPLSLIVLCAFLPLIATTLLRRRYCDGNEKLAGVVVCVLVVCLLIAIPVSHAIYQVSSIARMDDATRKALLAEGRKVSSTLLGFAEDPSYAANERMYVERHGSTGRLMPVAEFAEESIARYEEEPELWLSSLENVDQNVTFGFNDYGTWFERSQLAKLQYETTGETRYLDRYLAYLQWGSRALPPMRRSHYIYIQTQADHFEALLVESLRQLPASDYSDRPEILEAIGNLGTPESRAEARRRAFVSAFYQIRTKAKSNQSFSLGIGYQHPTGLYYWIEPRYHEQFVLAALEGIEAAKDPNNRSDQWRRKLLKLQLPITPYEQSKFARVHEGKATIADYQDRYAYRNQGWLWGGSWEYVTFDKGETNGN